jgi:hypothetical protein
MHGQKMWRLVYEPDAHSDQAYPQYDRQQVMEIQQEHWKKTDSVADVMEHQ